ncbi:MAG: GldG family protein [Verrucomicrobia bacterium]|nr:GldG family protein [Verrucomicrobiota bacterium]
MEKSSAPKRFIIGVNVITQVLLVAVVIVFLNLFIYRWHPPKADLSHNDYFKLSDKTKQLLKSLTAPVEVIVFFQPDSDDPVTHRVFNDVQFLLNEYKNVSSQIKVRYVDPDRDPINAEKLSKEYGVRDPNVVVFVYEKRNKFVPVPELVEFDRSGNPYGGGGNRIKAFKGEQQFTSAIQNVLDAKQPKIYFLTGHGEGDPEDYDQKKGFSVISKYIRRDNLLVEKVNLFEKQQIPKDCDVLIVCGPNRQLNELELNAIQQHLAQNGRAMFLFDAFNDETGLEKILHQHGVKIGNDIILSVGVYLGGKAILPEAHGVRYNPHPVTQGFKGEGFMTSFPSARSVDQATPADSSKGRVTVLVETSPNEWAETNLTKLRQEQKAEIDDKDRKGPVPVAVALEPSSAGEMEREGMRMVVFGSSGFIRNGSITGGNLDLFMNALNWLLKRQQLLGIAPKTPQEFSLSLTSFQQRAIFITEVIVIPSFAAVIGFLVWLKRRK